MYEPPLPEELDSDKIAEVALALLSLTLHDDDRVWKGLDWGVMHLLFEKGWITDPKSKAKSVCLSPKAKELAARFVVKHFGK
jgi:Domain of unknown function (DUF6429)